ncbi:MAG: hypothetical protein HY909_17770 [Deltaproteobacteria bacterium]|nr:hypothetical protein [Deltaproteobacteria bacterium]
MQSGAVWCWGGNGAGQSGHPADNLPRSPGLVRGIPQAQAVVLGWEMTCILSTEAQVWCWGDNTYGQLGTGTGQATDGPTMVPDLNSVLGLAAGTLHVCALQRGGAVSCWGNDGEAQLGLTACQVQRCGQIHSPCALGPLRNTLLPPLRTLTANATSSGGLAEDGTLWYWGWGACLSQHPLVRPPQRMSVPPGSVLAVGDHHCFVAPDGRVFCRGLNATGELGDDSVEERPTWGSVPGISDAVEVRASSWGHRCALLRDGSLWCWGSNSYGQLGDGSTTSDRCASYLGFGAPTITRPCRRRPIRVPLPGPVRAFGLGYEHTCAVLTDGTIWCWGRNDEGQLGDGTTIERRSPARVLVGPPT